MGIFELSLCGDNMYLFLVIIIFTIMGLPCGSVVENALAVRDTWASSRIGKIPWQRERLPTPVFWPGEFHGVAKNWTRLSNFHSLTHSILGEQFGSVQLLSRVRLFVTPWTAARLASLSITNSQSLLKLIY